MPEAKKLELVSTIGFEGKVLCGVHVHPDGVNCVYPTGTSLVMSDLKSPKQKFYNGHTHFVSCMCISKSGKFIASGQVNHMGFKAPVIIWDCEGRKVYGSHEVHKVRVESLSFSCRDRYVASLGGRDDANVIVYDVTKKEPLCGLQSATGPMGYAKVLRYLNTSEKLFLTGGDMTLRLWQLDVPNRKVLPTDAQTRKIRRVIRSLEIDSEDRWAYGGTETGDILLIRLEITRTDPGSGKPKYDVLATLTDTLVRVPRRKGEPPDFFQKGAMSLMVLDGGKSLLVGSGSGRVSLVRRREGVSSKKPGPMGSKYSIPMLEGTLVEEKGVKLVGGVTSLSCLTSESAKGTVLIGTDHSQLYQLELATFTTKLVLTCHMGGVTCVAYPHGCSDLFATSSQEDVRIWSTRTNKELLRISVPNMQCSVVVFTRDGRYLMTGWSDGEIRSFTPETGRKVFSIHNAHKMGVSALAVTSDGKRLVSGGREGIVRMWDITPHKQTLLGSLNEHKGAVTCIHIRSTDKECVTSSSDGSCIVWDLDRFVRNQIMFANTLFTGVRYHPSEVQIITCGTDRKVGYWETLDGCSIRELEGSLTAAVNVIDVTANGLCMVTGGVDMVVKVWRYYEGDVSHEGHGHTSPITALGISPGAKFIITASSGGAIFRWKFPEIDTKGKPVTAGSVP